MHRKGHYGAGLLGYAPFGVIALAFGFDAAAVAGGAATLGLSILPDYDMKLPGVAHRGPTHTLRFALAVGVVVAVLAALATLALAPAVYVLAAIPFGFLVGTVGILSHIAADALTPMGVEPFGDDGPHYTLDLVRADNTLANYALLGLGILAASVAVQIGEAIHAAVAAG